MSYRTCDHQKEDGVPCGSPALRGKKLCYFHQRDHQRLQQFARIRRCAETLHLPPLGSLRDIQAALFEVIDALAANRIDPKRAGALLFASLHLRVPHAA